MCLGIMPVTGVPLPFVSYGGSSLFAGMLAVGLLQNIATRAHQQSRGSKAIAVRMAALLFGGRARERQRAVSRPLRQGLMLRNT